MKKLLLILPAAALLMNLGMVSAGKPFEGVITFKISYPDSKASESQMAMFPKVLTVSVKGTKSRTDLAMSGMNTITITDHSEKTSVRLLNLMGQKYAIRETTAEIEKKIAAEGKVTVEYKDDTRTIAGYPCKKVIATVSKDGTVTTFEGWYNTEFGSKMANFDNPLFKDIDGTLLEFVMQSNEITMKFTATAVEKKNLADKDFEIPSDYVLTTQDELRSKFGGGGND